MAWDNRDGKSQDQHWYLLGRAASALLGTRETVWPPSSQLAGQICKPPSSPFASRRFFQNPSGQNRSSELFLAFSQIVFYRVLNQAKEMSQGDFSEAAIKRIHHIWIIPPYRFPIPHFFFPNLGWLLIFQCISSLFCKQEGNRAAFCLVSRNKLKRSGLGSGLERQKFRHIAGSRLGGMESRFPLRDVRIGWR